MAAETLFLESGEIRWLAWVGLVCAAEPADYAARRIGIEQQKRPLVRIVHGEASEGRGNAALIRRCTVAAGGAAALRSDEGMVVGKRVGRLLMGDQRQS